MVALSVELAGAGELIPGLEVLGYCFVQQGALGVARVVELGFTPGKDKTDKLEYGKSITDACLEVLSQAVLARRSR